MATKPKLSGPTRTRMKCGCVVDRVGGLIRVSCGAMGHLHNERHHAWKWSREAGGFINLESVE